MAVPNEQPYANRAKSEHKQQAAYSNRYTFVPFSANYLCSSRYSFTTFSVLRGQYRKEAGIRRKSEMPEKKYKYKSIVLSRKTVFVTLVDPFHPSSGTFVADEVPSRNPSHRDVLHHVPPYVVEATFSTQHPLQSIPKKPRRIHTI